jgi:hypothetical protein
MCSCYSIFNCSSRGKNCIGVVIDIMLVSSVIDHGFELRTGQTKNYKISICCFCTNHAVLRSRSKDCLAQNQNNTKASSAEGNTREKFYQWPWPPWNGINLKRTHRQHNNATYMRNITFKADIRTMWFWCDVDGYVITLKYIIYTCISFFNTMKSV